MTRRIRTYAVAAVVAVALAAAAVVGVVALDRSTQDDEARTALSTYLEAALYRDDIKARPVLCRGDLAEVAGHPDQLFRVHGMELSAYTMGRGVHREAGHFFIDVSLTTRTVEGGQTSYDTQLRVIREDGAYKVCMSAREYEMPSPAATSAG